MAEGMPASFKSWQNAELGNSQNAAIAKPVFRFRFIVISLS